MMNLLRAAYMVLARNISHVKPVRSKGARWLTCVKFDILLAIFISRSTPYSFFLDFKIRFAAAGRPVRELITIWTTPYAPREIGC